ncbi:nitrilase-related carbon-nitrogen hydrolase [Chroococcidiopsis sp. SAG 2025]|uniref:nitrilase-related carbon-nitrogen hydrolase n=1 Tax=Chroococcidiopsis sp. SAG 2025 TaxID=171389 RepID=UPI0029371335|nr:nitrilase-related carbon-nitrogen hydrolase [Chroococcidiopsis sp. SAG 2025]
MDAGKMLEFDRKVGISVVQTAPVYLDAPHYVSKAATLEKAVKKIREAAAAGADLVVFPETFLPGFPYWSLDFKAQQQFAEIWGKFYLESVVVPGLATDRLCEVSRQTGSYVVMGINERDAKHPGRMYNSILFIGPGEGIIGVHRKVNITIHEQLFHTRGTGGKNLKVYDTKIGNLSGIICGEHIQLPYLYHLITSGTQVNCSLWPGYNEVPNGYDLKNEISTATKALAIFGKIWCALASTYIPEDERPSSFYSNTCFDQSYGGSGIINPNGQYVVGPIYNEDTILYAEADLKQNLWGMSVHNLNGSYGRWDLFKLIINNDGNEPSFSTESTPVLNEKSSRQNNAITNGDGNFRSSTVNPLEETASF